MGNEKNYIKNNPYDKIGTERAKQLRKDMTQQERRLWYGFLHKYPVRFYRQRPIDRYIVDFYCSAAKLAVELDGSQHYEDKGIVHDQQRTADLNRLGILVLRFTNTDVDRHFREVCDEIDRVVKQRA